jgi:glycosyltransferase involved in cell wall biosynthesis
VAKILVLTNMYPPQHYGGYELVCEEAVVYLRARGHEVDVLTSDLRVPGRADLEDDPRTHRALKIYWLDHELVSPPMRERLAIERHNQAALAQAVDRLHPDVVSVWAMGALSFGLLTTLHRQGHSVINFVNDDWLLYGPQLDAWSRVARRAGPLVGALERATGVPCRLPDLGRNGTYLFVSETIQHAAQNHSRWHYDDDAVIYGGVNTEQFDPVAWKPRSDWNWRLLCVSRVDPRKGLDTAVRALAKLPAEATLEILGRGEDEHLRELHTLIDDLGLTGRVTFGAVEREELARRYAAADVFLFTSRWSEPFGLTPLEAMACATPVVAAAVGGTAEFLVDDGNALCVAPDDVDAFAAAVQRLADDALLRARLVDGGRATVDELDFTRWLDEVARWHEAAADHFANGRPPVRRSVREVLTERLARP